MPIFVEWKWMEKTQTLLAVFHFWDDRTKENLRMRIKEYAFETVPIGSSVEYKQKIKSASNQEFTMIFTLPEYGRLYSKTSTYLSWAPSHSEFCLLTEVLTYANLINGLKPDLRKIIKEKLQGIGVSDNQCEEPFDHIAIDSDLLTVMPENSIISFSHQRGLSFEVRLEYVEYLRKIIKPYM
jgi:hypothetical protein